MIPLWLTLMDLPDAFALLLWAFDLRPPFAPCCTKLPFEYRSMFFWLFFERLFCLSKDEMG